jgi:hypothetical protein
LNLSPVGEVTLIYGEECQGHLFEDGTMFGLGMLVMLVQMAGYTISGSLGNLLSRYTLMSANPSAVQPTSAGLAFSMTSIR